MERPRDDSPSGLSDIAEGDGLLGTGLTVRIDSVSPHHSGPG